jgi:hypothetical protein
VVARHGFTLLQALFSSSAAMTVEPFVQTLRLLAAHAAAMHHVTM